MRTRTIRLLLWLPLAAFLIVLALVWAGLVRPHDSAIRSKLVGKPLPAFALRRADGAGTIATAMFADGRPRLVNLFASWCVPCAAEAPQLAALKRLGVPIVGVAVRDKPGDLAVFLGRTGDPYQAIAADDRGTMWISLGASGVPESYVVDGHGIIRRQIIGDIRPEQVAEVAAAVEGAR